MRTGATRLIAFGVLASLGATPAAHAKKVKSKGQVSIESRAFMPDDIDRTDDYGFGVAARLEAKYKKKPFELKAGIFARTDALDDTRAASLEGLVAKGRIQKSSARALGLPDRTLFPVVETKAARRTYIHAGLGAITKVCG